MSTKTAVHDLAPGRDDLKETVESTAWYLFVGAIGAALGINVYASRLHPRVCNPEGLLATDPCSQAVIGMANQYVGIAAKVAIVCFLVGAGFLLVDVIGDGGETDA